VEYELPANHRTLRVRVMGELARAKPTSTPSAPMSAMYSVPVEPALLTLRYQARPHSRTQPPPCAARTRRDVAFRLKRDFSAPVQLFSGGETERASRGPWLLARVLFGVGERGADEDGDRADQRQVLVVVQSCSCRC